MKKKNGRQRAIYHGRDTKRRWPSTKRPTIIRSINAILPNSRPLKLPRTRKGKQALLHKARCRLDAERPAFHQSIDRVRSAPPGSQVLSENTQRLRLTGSEKMKKPGISARAQAHVHHGSDRLVSRVEVGRSNVMESSRHVGTAGSWGYIVTMRLESVTRGEGTNHRAPVLPCSMLPCCFPPLLKTARPTNAPFFPAQILLLYTSLALGSLFFIDAWWTSWLGWPPVFFRQDDRLWQKLKAYENLLLKFVPQVDDDDQQAIQDAIHMVLNQQSYYRT